MPLEHPCRCAPKHLVLAWIASRDNINGHQRRVLCFLWSLLAGCSGCCIKRSPAAMATMLGYGLQSLENNKFLRAFDALGTLPPAKQATDREDGGEGAARVAAAVAAAEAQLLRAKGQVARLQAGSARLWGALSAEVCPPPGCPLLHGPQNGLQMTRPWRSEGC